MFIIIFGNKHFLSLWKQKGDVKWSKSEWVQRTWNRENPTKVTQKPIPNQRRCVSISIVPPGASSFDLFPSHSLEAHVNLHAGELFPLLKEDLSNKRIIFYILRPLLTLHLLNLYIISFDHVSSFCIKSKLKKQSGRRELNKWKQKSLFSCRFLHGCHVLLLSNPRNFKVK